MAICSEIEFGAYVEELTPDQASNIGAIRGLLTAPHLRLSEEIDTGKWFGGMLTYYTPSRVFAFALGTLKGGWTSFHMMSFYGSKALQERHSEALKKFLSGKSCIKFKTFDQLPLSAIEEIISAVPEFEKLALELNASRVARTKAKAGPE